MSLTNEQSFFLNVLNEYIHSNNTSIPHDLDMDIVAYYAKIHQLEGIFYKQTKDKRFQKAFVASICTYENRKLLLQPIFERISCPFFIVKGIKIADLYPDPYMRTMGDIDLVVHSEDRASIGKILLESNFSNEFCCDNQEWHYRKANIEIELHDHLLYDEVSINEKEKSFFNNCWGYVKENELDWNFHFLFTLYHLKKHIVNSGAGFRQFMDIALIVEKISLDWGWIQANLQMLGLWKFASVILNLCHEWFGISIPVETGFVDKHAFEIITEKIFRDGVFGFDNEDNILGNNVNIYNKNGKAGLLHAAISVIFPTYKIMAADSRYSYLKMLPFLLPFAWLVRILKLLTQKRFKEGANRIRNVAKVNPEAIKKRNKIYEYLGLN